ncbi:hypothetical protein C5B42_06060 [Candidatus Cerribacteria bacterium 'Amazon FNV 2010 28 9']|uniref:Uncharacterized protein n=1 Tax=Candidatus Cerribacteria bacterium 'Amazon FNV 2010 28 9' TaxID=2081795 RepID=A0A317JLI5_9BACT|nr:MAG: hypothetical protein C5B42_06060 [Candidatus Cerribacteria bacterium 'Amazon FNV 2010 28 9']
MTKKETLDKVNANMKVAVKIRQTLDAQRRERNEDVQNKENLAAINVNTFGCMDGRKIIFKSRKNEGQWVTVTDQKAAVEVVEPHVPGAGLGFIAVLEQVAHLPQDGIGGAIEVAEAAFKTLGMEPQFHIDNKHGDFSVEGKTDKEIFAFIETHVEGCGFAALIWGKEGAVALLHKLIQRGWIVEMLGGEHGEEKALEIESGGKAIDTAKATEAHAQRFTFNKKETQRALEAMERGETFVADSMRWFTQKFADIALALRKIDTVSSVRA